MWQKIDNTSVISGAGTGQKVTKWDGTSGAASETLTDGPITFSSSNNDSTFAGSAIFTNGAAFASAASIRQQSDILILTGGGNGFAFNDDTNAVSNLLINAGGEATFSSKVGIAGKTPAYGLTLAQGTGVNNKIAWTDATPNFRASMWANSSDDKFKIATGNASSVETVALEIDTSQNSTFAGTVTVNSRNIFKSYRYFFPCNWHWRSSW